MTLANKRARYVYDLLDEYFKNNEQFEKAVKLNINKIGVNGPSYSYGTHTQIDKYAPYQYVIIQLNGQSENDEEIKVIKSKDNELKRSEEHTSELQSRPHLVCRLVLE